MEDYSHDDAAPSFCIGQHESNRQAPVTPWLIYKAHESNYDMVTAPITTASFHTRVLSQLSSHLSNLQTAACDASGTMGTTENSRSFDISPLSRTDTHLMPDETTSHLIGVTSAWIDLCSPDPLIADISRQVLMLEVNYAAFCGLSFLLIPGPKLHHRAMHSEGLMYYARAVQDVLADAPYIHVHIWMRMVDDPTLEVDVVGDLAPLAREEFVCDSDEEPLPDLDLLGTWDAWDLIRRACKYHGRLVVALSLPKQLPPMFVQSRWHSEPVRIFTLHDTTFVKNQKGYPVLSRAHQALISRFMRLRTAPWLLLCDVGPIPGLEFPSTRGPYDADYPSLGQAASYNKPNYDATPHLSYVRNLQQRQPSRNAIERFGIGYQDYLQAPLQPLTVNLESITYEVFEKDPIKYDWYERAIAKALTDWSKQKKPASGPNGKVVVAVVGAGRGPLVTRALQASAQTGVEIDMWAVEKNPNAFVLLQHHNHYTWDWQVTLVQSDMRSWKGPRRDDDARDGNPTGGGYVDILVSELLGSFGDNELSPECLDGVTHHLNPTHGISIPASYSSHITPICAPRLHADVLTQSFSNPAAPEIPYVVMLHAIDYLSTTTQSSSLVDSKNQSQSPTQDDSTTPYIQTAWSFSHPNRSFLPSSSSSSSSSPPSAPPTSNTHNVRRTRLSFPIQHRGVCHGLAGYFETVLYPGVELSTNPVTMESKSADMISWFPIYFPLKTPLNTPSNGDLVLTMYRHTDDRKVWYEWMVEVFALEPTSSFSFSPAPAGLGGAWQQQQPQPQPQQQQQGQHQGQHQGQGQGQGSGRRHPRPGFRRVRMGMSDLHSSVKEGCLM